MMRAEAIRQAGAVLGAWFASLPDAEVQALYEGGPRGESRQIVDHSADPLTPKRVA